MAKKTTNYGPIGCVLVIGLLGAIGAGLYYMSEWYRTQGPSEERITAVTIGLVKTAVGGPAGHGGQRDVDPRAPRTVRA